LTIIAVTFGVLLLFPVGAWALSFSNVAITDPGGVHQAKVNASGQLSTAVKGSVTANVAYPTSAIVHSDGVPYPNDCSGGTCIRLIAPPAGKALVVTAIHIDTFQATSTGTGIYVAFYRSNDATCSFASLDQFLDLVNPGGIGSTQLQYDLPGGMPIPAGKALCMQDSSPTNLGAQVTAWGYSVPSTAVPATAPAPGSATGRALLKPQQ
jgi:hypothetical protein